MLRTFQMTLVFMTCVVMLSRLFIAALWSPVGNGLASGLVCDIYGDFVTFPFGILGGCGT